MAPRSRTSAGRAADRLAIGTWPPDCIQRVFVDGATWWQFHAYGATAFPSERDQMAAEAVRRYGEPDPRWTAYLEETRRFNAEILATYERYKRADRATEAIARRAAPRAKRQRKLT
jgi:hypothetical protein